VSRQFVDGSLRGSVWKLAREVAPAPPRGTPRALPLAQRRGQCQSRPRGGERKRWRLQRRAAVGPGCCTGAIATSWPTSTRGGVTGEPGCPAASGPLRTSVGRTVRRTRQPAGTLTVLWTCSTR
jgi:hypothetical protein